MADYSPDSFLQQIFGDDQASPENISFGLNQNASGFDASGYSQFQQQSLINQPSSTTSPGSFSMNSSNPVIQYSPRSTGNTALHNVASPISKIPSPLQNSPSNNISTVLNSYNDSQNYQYQVNPNQTIHPQNQQILQSPNHIENWADFTMPGYNEYKKHYWAFLKDNNPSLVFKECNHLIVEEWRRLKEKNGILVSKKPSIKKRKHEDGSSLDGSVTSLNRPASSLENRSLAGMGSKSMTGSLPGGKITGKCKSVAGKSVAGSHIGGKSIKSTSKSISGHSRHTPRCDICRKEFKTLHNYNTHMISKPHKMMIKQLKNSAVLAGSQTTDYSHHPLMHSSMNSNLSFTHLQQNSNSADMVLSPGMSAAMNALHVGSSKNGDSRRGSSVQPSATTSGIHGLSGPNGWEVHPKLERDFNPVSIVTSIQDTGEGMSSGTKESDNRRFELSDNYFGLRSLAEQIKEKVDSRQAQVNKIRLEILEMEQSPSYQAIQKHKICSKQLQDLTSAFQSLIMKYRKNDDEQLAWNTTNDPRAYNAFTQATMPASTNLPQNFAQNKLMDIHCPQITQNEQYSAENSDITNLIPSQLPFQMRDRLNTQIPNKIHNQMPNELPTQHNTYSHTQIPTQYQTSHNPLQHQQNAPNQGSITNHQYQSYRDGHTIGNAMGDIVNLDSSDTNSVKENI